MEVKGRIIAVLPETSGIAKATGNPWKKREYVLETFDSFPRKVHFDFFGERAEQYPLNLGDNITLSFDIESREYNGRWYTSIRGWKAEKADAAMPGAPVPPVQDIQAAAYPGAGAPPAAPQAQAPFPGSDGTEDLPF